MTPGEIIRDIMKQKGVGIAEMGRRMGVSMQTASNRLVQSKNMTYKGMLGFCEALNYKVVIMPKGMKTPKGGYEVDDIRVCEGINAGAEE